MEQRPPRVPKVTWGKEEEESPGGALTQETEELVPFQPAQEGAAMDWTQEQEPTSGLFHRTLKDKTSTMGTGSMENCDVYSTNTSAALLDILVEEGLPNPKQVLRCLDMTKYGASLLEIMSKNLQSECGERCRLVLSGLVVPPLSPPHG
ncbi:uncharacterized protein LOC117006965 isoform X2 [Catharus ustulatus]|uniref:uncharacterized protein LOC117006965 isoform X2 n=1 Tax=Catharus ustulatus TaxID=91951 RepID=UPI0014083C41|nr:uncharacterized protein LOC117006965 isoform X2 [Catharus ustulatus]